VQYCLSSPISIFLALRCGGRFLIQFWGLGFRRKCLKHFCGGLFSVLFSVAFYSPVNASVTDPALALIRNHFLADIRSTGLPTAAPSWTLSEVEQWMNLEKADGSFSDIDYVTHDQPSWGHLDMISRVFIFALATETPGNPYYKNKKVLDHAKLAIHYWASHTWPPHKNWWHNEIGFPLRSYKVLLLIGDQLTPFDRAQLLKATEKGHILNHPSQFPADGQNLLWFGQITIALGVLENDPSLVALSVNEISKSLELGNPIGIQEDLSFFQHDQVFYNGGYGLQYSVDEALLFRLVGGTPYAFNEAHYNAFSQYILDGQLWLIHKRTFEYSALGRYYARSGAGESEQLTPACEVMALVPGPHQSEFRECAKNLSLSLFPGKIGNRLFWKSDFMTDNHSDYSISVKMRSNRVMNSDTSPLGEGLKSENLSDGVTYFYRTGLEYRDIFPVLDFLRLPGTTEEHLDAYPKVPGNNFHNTYGPTSFVGGVSDGTTGFSVMEYVREDLSANKTWFFHSGGMVALGGYIECDTCVKPVLTSINQEWSNSPVLYGSPNSKSEPPISRLDTGAATLDGPLAGTHWFLANDVGYVSLGNHKLVVQNQDQEGSWNELAESLPTTPVHGKVFSLWIDHGTHPTSSDYAYAVYPGVKLDELIHLAENPDFQILENDYYRQGVYFPMEGLIQGAFYWAGSLTWDEGNSWLNVSAMQIAAQIRKIGNDYFLSISSPNQTTKEVTVSWNWTGKTQGQKTILFPEGEKAGTTVTVKIN